MPTQRWSGPLAVAKRCRQRWSCRVEKANRLGVTLVMRLGENKTLQAGLVAAFGESKIGQATWFRERVRSLTTVRERRRRDKFIDLG